MITFEQFEKMRNIIKSKVTGDDFVHAVLLCTRARKRLNDSGSYPVNFTGLRMVTLDTIFFDDGVFTTAQGDECLGNGLVYSLNRRSHRTPHGFELCVAGFDQVDYGVVLTPEGELFEYEGPIPDEYWDSVTTAPNIMEESKDDNE